MVCEVRKERYYSITFHKYLRHTDYMQAYLWVPEGYNWGPNLLDPPNFSTPLPPIKWPHNLPTYRQLTWLLVGVSMTLHRRMEGRNGEGDWGSFGCPKTSSYPQTPTTGRNPPPISRYILGVPEFPWVSVDTKAMCEGRQAMRETPN